MVRKADIDRSTGPRRGSVPAGRLLQGILLLGLLSTGACRDGGADDATPGTTTTAPTTSAVPDGTASTAPTGPRCPGPALGAEIQDATVLDDPAVDVDGDGEADTVTSYRDAEGWHLRADLADGGTATEGLPTTAEDSARVETALDLDGDGSEELWVAVGNGASTTIFGLFRMDGCDLGPVGLDGTPATFAVGGPVLLLQGVRCTGEGTVVHLGATTEDGTTYTTLDITYELQAGSLVAIADASGTLAGDDPALADYSTFAC